LIKCNAASAPLRVWATTPSPDTETEGSPLDFPEEFIKAPPSRRPDISPELEPYKPGPPPTPLPGDPEEPDEEMEFEEKKKEKPKQPDEEKEEGEEGEEPPPED